MTGTSVNLLKRFATSGIKTRFESTGCAGFLALSLALSHTHAEHSVPTPWRVIVNTLGGASQSTIAHKFPDSSAYSRDEPLFTAMILGDAVSVLAA